MGFPSNESERLPGAGAATELSAVLLGADTLEKWLFF